MQMRKQICSAAAVVVFFLGFISLNCAFTSQVTDRSLFDKGEMMFDNILPDRDLPDISGTIASEWGSGAGGGAVGGCWN